MNEIDVITVVREGLWTGLKVAGPALAAALLSGLGVAFFQALTQIQEITLTFVPKIFAIFLAVVVGLPFMHQALKGYAAFLTDKITNGY